MCKVSAFSVTSSIRSLRECAKYLALFFVILIPDEIVFKVKDVILVYVK